MKLVIFDYDIISSKRLRLQIEAIDNSFEVLQFSSCSNLYEYLEKSGDDTECIFIGIEVFNDNITTFLNYIVDTYHSIKMIFIIRKSESYIEDIFLKMPKVTPYGILKKPINADKLRVYLNRLKESNTTEVKTYVLPFKATKMGTVYIPLDDITFIKSVGRTVEVHTVSNQMYVGYEKLSNVYKTLSEFSKNFYQCQKSYIVNVCAVTSIPSNENRIYVKGSNEYISLSNINGVSVSKKRKEIVQLKSLMTPKNTMVDD